MHHAVILYCIVATVLGGTAHAEQLTREDAVAIAVKMNPRVAAAQAEWEAARAERLVSIALEDPELEIEYEELPGVFDTGSFGERNVGITQRIESPFKWWYRQRAAGQAAESVRFSSFEATRLDVIFETKTAFDRVVVDREILKAARENLELAREFEQKARTRFQAGDVARLEVMRAEVEAGLAENALADAEASLATSKATLNVVLGRNVSEPVDPVGDLALGSASYDLDSLKDRAALHRPDLKGADRSVRSVRSIKSGTVAALVPDLNFGVSRQTIAGANSRSSFWRTSFGIEIPVWAPFRQRGEVSAARAAVRRAEAEYTSLLRATMLEVEVGYAELTAARKRATVFESRVLELASATHQAASESYREGKATYLELLEAQRTLTETKIANYESIFAYRRALAELERATGGSLQ